MMSINENNVQFTVGILVGIAFGIAAAAITLTTSIPECPVRKTEALENVKIICTIENNKHLTLDQH